MGKVQKKVKKTNNSAFSATQKYIKITLVSFFYFFFHAPSPYQNTMIIPILFMCNSGIYEENVVSEYSFRGGNIQVKTTP